MNWTEEQLETLDRLAQSDKGGELTWDIIANRMNRCFKTHRTAESCRKRWVRYINSQKALEEK